MIKSPKSLTATIHVRFHYKENETDPLEQGTTETIAKILDEASDMDPGLQELLIKFANYLSQISQKQEG